MKYMPLGMASIFVALLAAVVLYAGWCGGASGAVRGLQFGLLMGVFVACIHPPIERKMGSRLGGRIDSSQNNDCGAAELA